jgi:aerotaxis receptor
MNNLHKVLKNMLTENEIVLPEPKDEEIELYDNSLLITETDIEGIIRYANRRFCKVSGYTKEELIGMPHTITYHPDMPEGLFIARKKIVNEKKIWRGYIKSLSKSGAYYWSLAYVQVKLDKNNEIIGYTETRKKAYEDSLLEAESKYKELQGKEHLNDEYFMKSESFDDVLASLYSIND